MRRNATQWLPSRSRFFSIEVGGQSHRPSSTWFHFLALSLAFSLTLRCFAGRPPDSHSRFSSVLFSAHLIQLEAFFSFSFNFPALARVLQSFSQIAEAALQCDPFTALCSVLRNSQDTRRGKDDEWNSQDHNHKKRIFESSEAQKRITFNHFSLVLRTKFFVLFRAIFIVLRASLSKAAQRSK